MRPRPGAGVIGTENKPADFALAQLAGGSALGSAQVEARTIPRAAAAYPTGLSKPSRSDSNFVV